MTDVGDNRDRLRGLWTAGDWAALDDLLRLDGFGLRHCAHCDRYDGSSPDQHPSCLIVTVEHRERVELP